MRSRSEGWRDKATPMLITSPAANATFTISGEPKWPSVIFTTDAPGVPHTWQWTISWGTFTKTGTANTATNTWDATNVVTNLGGIMTVRASAKPSKSNAMETAAVSVKILGTNPTPDQVS